MFYQNDFIFLAKSSASFVVAISSSNVPFQMMYNSKMLRPIFGGSLKFVSKAHFQRHPSCSKRQGNIKLIVNSVINKCEPELYPKWQPVKFRHLVNLYKPPSRPVMSKKPLLSVIVVYKYTFPMICHEVGFVIKQMKVVSFTPFPKLGETVNPS